MNSVRSLCRTGFLILWSVVDAVSPGKYREFDGLDKAEDDM